MTTRKKCAEALKHSVAKVRQYDEESKEYWYIDDIGAIQIDNELSSVINMRKLIGNYFETLEEATKAVGRLHTWKRLKDKGFKFKSFIRLNDCDCAIRATFDESWSEIYDDLDLLFGGEE